MFDAKKLLGREKMALEINLLDVGAAYLGESPLWDARINRLWWVDSHLGLLHSSDAEGRDPRQYALGQAVGSIGLAEDGLLLALADGFYHYCPEKGKFTPIAKPSLPDGVRLNDGKADRAGRFFCATMRVGDAAPGGGLFRLDRDASLHLLEQDIAIGNAISFSPDGATLYFADSMDGMLRRYDYDADDGHIGPRQDLVDCRAYGSGVDGATVDSEGRIWTALVMAQTLACFAPNGELLRSIPMPLPFPSCPAFGGPDMDILYLTSIANSGHRLVADHPDAGRITAISGLDAQGIAEGVYR